MSLKLLWGSPLPPSRTGVSDYTVDLLSELRELAEIRLLAPPSWERPAGWRLADLEVVPADTPAAADELCVLNLGNNPHHDWLLTRLLDDGPAVLVLHDLVLHHLLVEASLGHGDALRFDQWMEQAHGARGTVLARARAVGVTGPRDPFLFPARRPFLERAAAAVVHSRWAREQVADDAPDLPVLQLGLPVHDPGPVERAAVRRELGLDSHDVVLMHLGFLTPEKGMHEVMLAVAAARRLGIPVQLVLVGEGDSHGRLAGLISELALGEFVHSTGWVPAETLPLLPAAADLGVVLRTPSAGETSAAAVRFFACGTPVAVGGGVQFLEWPDAAAPRLLPGPAAAAGLCRLLAEAAVGGGGWDDRRRAARAAYERDHRPSAAADRLARFLEAL